MLRPQTHAIATAKQSCVCTEIYSYESAQKTVATRAAPFGSDMHQIVCRWGLRPRPHWRSLQRSPDPLAGVGGGPPGEMEVGRGGGKEGWEGKGGEEVPEGPNPELASLVRW